jgi:multiple antibiotic resistance protein
MIALDTLLPALAAVDAAPAHYAIGAGEMFTLLFIMLGPLKLLGAFASETRSLGAAEVRALALRAALIGATAVIAGGIAGGSLLRKWEIDPQILLLSLGLIFFTVAFKLVMQQYAVPPARPAEGASAQPPGPLRIVFPLIAPPYGVAVVIVLLALSESRPRTALICALVLANMLLNLLAMLFAHKVMRGAGLALMQVLGAVLGVLQVALALQIMLYALTNLGVLEIPELQR